MNEDVLVRVSDARELGFCVRGIKQFCDENGLSFRELCKNGLPAAVLEQTGDERAVKLVRYVRTGARTGEGE